MLRNVNESAESLSRPARKPVSDLAREWMAVAFAPLAKLLHRLNVSPNAITILGCGFSLLGGAFIAAGRWPLAAGIVVLGGLLDGMDGLLARHTGQTTRFGAFLDSVLDRWSDSALFIGLLIYYSGAGMRTYEVLSIVALASCLLVSYTRARAEGVGAECSRGLFTRLERLVALLVGLVLHMMEIALWVIAILSTLTALQRIYYTWRYLKVNARD